MTGSGACRDVCREMIDAGLASRDRTAANPCVSDADLSSQIWDATSESQIWDDH